MTRFALAVICLLGMISFTALGGTYTLTDGSQVTGDPSINEEGVVLKTGADTFLPRIAWSRFTQDSLRQLRDDAKTPKERALLDPMIESLPSEKAKRKEIVVKPVETPQRPTSKDGTLGLMAIFGSPLGLTILLIVYGANLFAAYEVAVYRRQPLSLVGGLAAIPVFGIASPIVFLAIPSRFEPSVESIMAPGLTAPTDMSTGAPTADNASAALRGAAEPVPSPSAVAEAQSASGQPAAPTLPPPQVFRRGEFSFNRRFFETKLAGFFRLVPAESDKDLLIYLRATRGDFVGKRITKVTPAELYLQVFKNDATADEMIPFVEISEVQVRHKDLDAP